MKLRLAKKILSGQRDYPIRKLDNALTCYRRRYSKLKEKQ